MSKNNEKRRNEILKKLEQQPSLRIKELAESFQVTTETLRKDLFVLEQRGQVNKTHGYVHRKDGYDELPIEVKVEENTELKDQIARKAIEFVSDYSVVYLDPGSTTLSIGRYFALKKGCTIVTPSIRIVQSLLALKHEILLIGGLIQKKGSTTTGAFALDNLNHVKIDTAFMGTDGFKDCQGPTTFSFQKLSVKQKVIEQSKQKILVCDRSKFFKTGTYPFARFSDYDKIITNPIDPKEKAMIDSAKEIVIA